MVTGVMAPGKSGRRCSATMSTCGAGAVGARALRGARLHSRLARHPPPVLQRHHEHLRRRRCGRQGVLGVPPPPLYPAQRPGSAPVIPQQRHHEHLRCWRCGYQCTL